MSEASAGYSYDKIDHFLRNNLDDSDYAEYSNALEEIFNYVPDSAVRELEDEISRLRNQLENAPK